MFPRMFLGSFFKQAKGFNGYYEKPQAPNLEVLEIFSKRFEQINILNKIWKVWLRLLLFFITLTNSCFLIKDIAQIYGE